MAVVGPVVVVAATRFEWAICRAVSRTVPLVHTGVAGVPRLPPGSLVLSVGLCGALRRDLAPGTLVIPRHVGIAGGRFATDEAATEALLAAARARGVHAVEEDLVTTVTVVSGAERGRLAAEGYAAADMETGLLAAAGFRFATARAVLDGPDNELPVALAGNAPWWRRPLSAVGSVRLAVPATRGVALAARIAAAAAAAVRGRTLSA
ncbi:MAG TPA: hypothetical protein VI316_02300 [Candidatus Dormibacteraeota bacterium]